MSTILLTPVLTTANAVLASAAMGGYWLFFTWAALSFFQLIAWPRIARSGRWQGYTLAGVLALGAVHMWLFATLAEDAFITFRYSLNLTNGNGPVFNAGERVEGYSNFLWMVLLAAPKAVANVDIVLFARILGVLCALGALIFCYLLVRRITNNGAAGVLAATITAAAGSFAAYAGSGLETPLFVLLVLALLWFVVADRPLLAGLLATLATMTRPEGVVVAAVVAAWLLLRALRADKAGNGWRPLRWFVGAAVVSVAPWTVWRLAYYGYLLPNAVAAKSGGPLGVQLAGGWQYFVGFVGVAAVLLLLVPVAMLTLVAARGRTDTGTRSRIWLLFAVAVSYVAFVIATGGDWMPAWRMLVLPIPLLAGGVLATWTIAGESDPAARRVGVGRRAAPVLVATLAVLTLSQSVLNPDMKAAIGVWHREVNDLGDMGTWLGRHLPAGTVIATFANGSLSYHIGTAITVVDVLGLTDEHIARHGRRTPTGRIGHQAYDYDYVVNVRRPAVVLTNGGGYDSAPSCGAPGPYAKDYVPLNYEVPGKPLWAVLYVRGNLVDKVTGWLSSDPAYQRTSCSGKPLSG